MEADKKYQTIWLWHPENHQESRDKLVCFLSGWMGGPVLYREKYGPIDIIKVHAHLKVTMDERDLWLACMRAAMDTLAYPDSLKEYLFKQLSIPAERIRLSTDL
jgi:hemoglobin